jgi:hypothetical protein
MRRSRLLSLVLLGAATAAAGCYGTFGNTVDDVWAHPAVSVDYDFYYPYYFGGDTVYVPYDGYFRGTPYDADPDFRTFPYRGVTTRRGVPYDRTPPPPADAGIDPREAPHRP